MGPYPSLVYPLIPARRTPTTQQAGLGLTENGLGEYQPTRTSHSGLTVLKDAERVLDTASSAKTRRNAQDVCGRDRRAQANAAGQSATNARISGSPVFDRRAS